jgi:hypothetical protein
VQGPSRARRWCAYLHERAPSKVGHTAWNGASQQNLSDEVAHQECQCQPDAAQQNELEDEFAENSSGSDAPEVQKMPILSGFSAGGAEGGRTPDLLIANKESGGNGGADRIGATEPFLPHRAITQVTATHSSEKWC